MCMNSEAVEALHALTSELKAEHKARDEWLRAYDPQEDGAVRADPMADLKVTRAEAERIFADRIAAHEARLKELGWERKIRVEYSPATGATTAVGSVGLGDIPRI